jgi:TDG/mug DNA glycosylase family protein
MAFTMPRDTPPPRLEPIPADLLRSFPPLADERSRVLVLGTMPGPEALRRQEYYGFPGNHFWRIMRDLLAGGRELSYAEKIALVRKHRIALWDVLASCERIGALDSAIKNVTPNAIPKLLARYPGIHTVFCNGALSAKLFGRFFAGQLGARLARPMIQLPSTSPANAAMPYPKKREIWSIVIERARAASPPKAARSPRAPR